jgi:NitT/TauT family transport system substrate-binding protein
MAVHYGSTPATRAARLGRVVLLLLALGLIGACAPTAQGPAAKPETQAAPQSAPRPAPQSVTIVLDWIDRNPQHMGFILAKERGWYAEQGLDVNLQSGRGSVQVLQLVTAGQAEFGLINGVTQVQAVAKQNVPAKMVAVVYQKDNLGLRYFEATGMKSLKDLEGRRVGLVTGSIQHLLWPAFARASGIDVSKVEVVNVDVQTYVQQWSNGQFDAANTGLGTYETVAFDRQGRRVVEVTFAETLPLVGFGVVTPQKLITDRPEVVRGFVKASQKGWDYLVKSPQEAIAEAVAVIKRNDEDTRDADGIAEAANKMIPGFMQSRSTEGKPLGWSNPDDWRQMIAVLQQVEPLPRTPEVDELMTNQFVE